MTYFKSPLMDIWGNMNTYQSAYENPLCRALEMQFLKCIEVRGTPNYMRDCKDEHDDLHECVYKRKQQERYIAIQNERTRQFEAGQLKERFIPPPYRHAYGSPLIT